MISRGRTVLNDLKRLRCFKFLQTLGDISLKFSFLLCDEENDLWSLEKNDTERFSFLRYL